MKANRPFARDEGGISPIIGTLLAVGMTIVLSAIVFVISSQSSKNTAQETPRIAFTKMTAALQVVSAPNSPYVDWTDLSPTGTCVSNGHLLLAPLGGTPAAYPAVPGTLVSPGDQLSGCATGETLVLTHRATNSVVYNFNF